MPRRTPHRGKFFPVDDTCRPEFSVLVVEGAGILRTLPKLRSHRKTARIWSETRVVRGSSALWRRPAPYERRSHATTIDLRKFGSRAEAPRGPVVLSAHRFGVEHNGGVLGRPGALRPRVSAEPRGCKPR